MEHIPSEIIEFSMDIYIYSVTKFKLSHGYFTDEFSFVGNLNISNEIYMHRKLKFFPK